MDFVPYEKKVRFCDLPIEYLIKMCLLPPFQRVENTEHVDQIYKGLEDYYTKYHDIFLPGVISVGKYVDKEKYVIFDGQHRIKALQQLYKKYDIGHLFTRVDIYSIKTEEEALSIYHIINSNVKVELFDGNIEPYFIPRFQKFMRDTFPDFCKTTKNPRGLSINLDEMAKRVKGYHLIEKLGVTLENAQEVVFDLVIKLNQFYQKQKIQAFTEWGISDMEEKYEKYLKDSPCPFFLGLWRNYEWIEQVIDSSVNKSFKEISHLSSDTEIKKRQKIPHSVRERVWEKRNGKLMTGDCFTCNKSIKFTNFHCGHITSVKNGGGNSIENLEPICVNCNLDMGTMNLNDYKNLFI